MIKFWGMYRIFNKVWPCIFCGTFFVCPQSPCRGNDMMFWISPIVQGRPLVLHVTSTNPQTFEVEFHLRSLPSGFSRQLVLKPVVLILFLLHHAEDTRPGRNSSHDSLRVAVPSPTPEKKREGGNVQEELVLIVLCDVKVIYVSYVNKLYFRERASVPRGGTPI